MKCNIVKDLMPLYLDDLCSEETKAELENHIEECEDCKKLKEELALPEPLLETETKDLNKSIAPLKKVKKKMRKKNRLITLCVALLIVLLGVTSWLTYGQLTGNTMSFEMLHDMVKINKAGKAFAKGDIDPLYDLLYDGYIVQDSESAVLSIAYEDDATYEADMKAAIMEKYNHFFANNKLSYEGIEEVAYLETPGTGWNKRPLLSLKFQGEENLEYHIMLYKAYPDSYLAKDYFGNPYITYTTDGNADNENGVREDFFQTSDTLFACMPNQLQDISLSMIKKVVMVSGQRALKGDTTLAGNMQMRLDVLSQKDLEKGTRALRNLANDRLQGLTEYGYYVTDITWNVKEYDTEKHLYRYQIDIEMNNGNDSDEFIISTDCYRISEAVFLYIPGTDKVYGNAMTDEVLLAIGEGLFVE